MLEVLWASQASGAISQGILVLVLWAVATLLILFDLYRARQKRLQGQRSAWYERPLPWFAACGFPFGLILASGTLIGHLSYPLYGYILLGVILLLFFFLAIGLIAVLRLEMKQNARDEEVRLRQLAASSPVPVAAYQQIMNPAILTMTMMVTMLILLLPFDLVAFYTHRTLDQLSWGRWIFLLAGIWLLLLFAGLITRSRVQKRLIKRLNYRRSKRAAENQQYRRFVPVSLEPVQTLMPPLTLHLKRVVINGDLALIAAFILAWLHLSNAVNGFNIFYSIFYSLLFLFRLLRGLRERIETNTQGLVIVRGVWFVRSKQHMPWQEATLFTCHNIPGSLGGKTTMTYELSSAGRVVQWTRVIDTHSRLAPWKTEVPMDEYNRQTQELCEIITRQTGLQLHDLSEEVSKAREQEMIMQSHT